MRPAFRRGFTLIELLIVIGVLAILATTVVLLINPTEYLGRARDSQRVNDLSAIKNAVQLAATFESLKGKVLDYDGPDYEDSCVGQSDKKIFVSVPETETAPPPPSGGWAYAQQPALELSLVNGSGWMPIAFTDVFTPQSPPLSRLPVDPVNTFASGYYYSYVCGSFALSAKMESAKFAEQAAGDGGVSPGHFDIGTNLADMPTLYTPEDTEALCNDGKDNDGDNKVDGDDPKCAGGETAPPPPPPPTAPDITGATPNQGPNNGSVAVNISGNNFQSGATVKLYCLGQPDIPGSIGTFSTTLLNNVSFNLTNALSTCPWSIVVTNPDLQVDTFSFDITQGQQQTGYRLGSSFVVISNSARWTHPSDPAANSWFSDQDPPSSISQIGNSNTFSVTPTIAFSGFGFTTIPPSSLITGICVHLNNVSIASSIGGNQKWRIALSKDGGTNEYTAENQTMPDITTTNLAGIDQYFANQSTAPSSTEPGICTTWGQSWLINDIANLGVRVRADNSSSLTAADLRFDVARVNVHFLAP